MSLFEGHEVIRTAPLTAEQVSILHEGTELANQFGLDERYEFTAELWLETEQEWAFEDLATSVVAGCDEETTAGDRDYYDSKEGGALKALATKALWGFGIENAAYMGSKSAMLTMFKVDEHTGSELPHSKYAIGIVGEERPTPPLYEGECFDFPDDHTFALERVLRQRSVGLFYSSLATIDRAKAGEASLEWALSNNWLLAEEFTNLAWFDQNMRAKVITGEYEWHEIIDEDNEKEFRRILERYGWPTISHVGETAADMAVTIVQHAPNPDFIADCLGLMKACQEGEVSPRNIAFVEDRLLVIRGLSQIYGTQFRHTESGIELYPIDAPESIDARRASVGLGNLAGYKDDLNLFYSL